MNRADMLDAYTIQSRQVGARAVERQLEIVGEALNRLAKLDVSVVETNFPRLSAEVGALLRDGDSD